MHSLVRYLKMGGARLGAALSGVPGPIGRVARAMNKEFDYAYLLSRAAFEDAYIKRLKDLAPMKSRPKVSLVVPSYGIDLLYVKELLTSVKRQSYSNWEICLCDDRDPTPGVYDYLAREAANDPDRIKVTRHEQNQGISGATRTALTLATGELIAFVDADDLLHRDCLDLVVRRFVSDDEIDLVYTDHDLCSDLGHRTTPHRKPGWSPELLLNTNYINHLAVVRRACLDRCAPVFRDEVGGSQDWDFCLRATSQARRVSHIPVPLYHWRQRPGSVATGGHAKPWAFQAAERVRREQVERLNEVVTLADWDGASTLGAELTLRRSIPADALPRVMQLSWDGERLGKDGQPPGDELTYRGRLRRAELGDSLGDSKNWTLAEAFAAAEKLVLASDDDYVMFQCASAPALHGPVESLVAYASLKNIGGVWPFNANGLRLAYTIDEAGDLVPIDRDRGSFSRTSGNILTGPGHGLVIARDRLLAAIAAATTLINKSESAESAARRKFSGHDFAAILGLACVTLGWRNVATQAVRCDRVMLLPMIDLTEDLRPEVDPFL